MNKPNRELQRRFHYQNNNYNSLSTPLETRQRALHTHNRDNDITNTLTNIATSPGNIHHIFSSIFTENVVKHHQYRHTIYVYTTKTVNFTSNLSNANDNTSGKYLPYIAIYFYKELFLC